MRYRVEAPSIFTFPSGASARFRTSVRGVIPAARLLPLGITGELWDEDRMLSDQLKRRKFMIT